MNQTIKNILGVVGAVAVIVIAVGVWQGIAAYSKSVTSAASFSVTGEGKSTGTPDVAQVSFGITTQGGLDTAPTQQSNTNEANAAIAFVKSEGVAPADIQTANYQITPRDQVSSCIYPQVYNGVNPPAQACVSNDTVIGYTVTQ